MGWTWPSFIDYIGRAGTCRPHACRLHAYVSVQTMHMRGPSGNDLDMCTCANQVDASEAAGAVQAAGSSSYAD